MKNITYIGFGSEERDEESRYFNFGFRQYDPLTGRFLSPDPLFEKFTFCSPYQYAYNNPVSFKDPTGLAPESEKKKSNKMLMTEIEDIMADLRSVANRFEEFFQWSKSQLYGAMGFHYVSHLNMWTDNPFLFSVGDGSGVRLAALQTGSTNSIGINGLRAGTLLLGHQEKWNVNDLDAACKPAYEHLKELQKANTDNEVGFFLKIDDDDNLIALFYIGISSDTWLDFKRMPEDLELGENQRIIGFVHTHLDPERNHFSTDDLGTIGLMSLGFYKWTQIKNVANFNEDGYVSRILINDPTNTSKMFFGVIYPGGRDLLNFATSSRGLRGLYENIWQLGTRRDYNLLNDFYGIYYRRK